MNTSKIPHIVAEGISDREDHLLDAAEPLASLQRRCGGALPGPIAIPGLRDLVRVARRSLQPVSRMIQAFDGTETIFAWVEVVPDTAGSSCKIRVRTWQAQGPMGEDGLNSLLRRAASDRYLSELTAQLDANQCVLTAQADPGELEDIGKAMAAGVGQLWTDFLPPENLGHQHPLHWRLLDGARVLVDGSQRAWRVSLIPHGKPGFPPSGFELLLHSDEPVSVHETKADDPPHQSAFDQTSGSGQGIVGHDLAPVLRQPIARIIANAETIRTRLAGPLLEAYADYAGEIASAGNLLVGLLEDLADLELVEDAQFTTEAENIDLGEVAYQAAGILNVRAGEKHISVILPDVREAMPATAEFRRVLQILLNLIGNAIRYTPSGSALRITLDRAGAFARVHIADEGPGLSEQDMARVFDKFERLGRSGDGGSGLGLYISRRLARAMGGDLTVHSTLGSGSCFTLSLPADD